MVFLNKNASVLFVGLKVAGQLTIYPFEQMLRSLADYDIQPVESTEPRLLPASKPHHKKSARDSGHRRSLESRYKEDHGNSKSPLEKHADKARNLQHKAEVEAPPAADRVWSKKQVEASMEDCLSRYRNKKIDKSDFHSILEQLHARAALLPEGAGVKRRIDTIEKIVLKQETDGVHAPCYGQALKLMRFALRHPSTLLLNDTFSTVSNLDALALSQLLNETASRAARTKMCKLFELAQPTITCIRPRDIEKAYTGDDEPVREKLSVHHRGDPWLGGSLSRRRRNSDANGFHKAGHIVMLPESHLKADSGQPDLLKELARGDIRQAISSDDSEASETDERVDRVRKTVYIGDKATLNKWASNAMHELGHWVHELAGKTKPENLDITEVTISTRATENWKEWFADHFRIWFINPRGLREWNPEVADFIEANVEEATRFLKKQARRQRLS